MAKKFTSPIYCTFGLPMLKIILVLRFISFFFLKKGVSCLACVTANSDVTDNFYCLYANQAKYTHLTAQECSLCTQEPRCSVYHVFLFSPGGN